MKAELKEAKDELNAAEGELETAKYELKEAKDELKEAKDEMGAAQGKLEAAAANGNPKQKALAQKVYDLTVVGVEHTGKNMDTARENINQKGCGDGPGSCTEHWNKYVCCSGNFASPISCQHFHHGHMPAAAPHS